MIPSVVHLAVAYFMAALLIQASAHKILQRRAFQASLRGHGFIPKALEVEVLYLMALSELALGVAWIVAPQSAFVGIATALLLTIYGGVLYVSLKTGRGQAGCGCEWGSTPAPVQMWMIFRNLGLATLALSTLGPAPITSANIIEHANAIVFAMGGMLLYFAASQAGSTWEHIKLLKGGDHG